MFQIFKVTPLSNLQTFYGTLGINDIDSEMDEQLRWTIE